MQIEAGKFYRTRDGRKAFVAAVMLANPLGNDNAKFPVRGYIGNFHQCWYADGRWHENDYGADLVAPWVDPPTAMDVVNGVLYYVNSVGGHYQAWNAVFKEVIENAKAVKAAAEAEKAAEHGS